jgi:hypothetical protein
MKSVRQGVHSVLTGYRFQTALEVKKVLGNLPLPLDTKNPWSYLRGEDMDQGFLGNAYMDAVTPWPASVGLIPTDLLHEGACSGRAAPSG